MDKEIRIKAGRINQRDSIIGLEIANLEVVFEIFILIIKLNTKNKIPIIQPIIKVL